MARVATPGAVSRVATADAARAKGAIWSRRTRHSRAISGAHTRQTGTARRFAAMLVQPIR